MSFRSGSARQPAGRPSLAHPRWPRLVLPVIVAIIAFLVLITIVAGVWTDFLWYRAIHYSSVFGTTYGTRWAMFFVAALFMAVVTGANAALAYRLRPIYRPVPAPGQGGDAYRMAIDPHRRLLLGLVLALVGLISGITAAGSWRTWLLFANQVPFGKVDPQFNLGSVVLRLYLPVHPDGAELPVRGGAALAGAGHAGALPLRRAAACRAGVRG